MKIIAIRTARGGSKRIPKKNIKEFLGKPMLAYAIEAAQKAKFFDTIMVSTDDTEIAQTAQKYGAQVPFMRSAKTSSDYAITYDVLEEVLTEYQKLNIHFDIVCCIYPCVPFLNGDSLKTAYKQMTEEKTDAIIPVCKYPVPIEWAMTITDRMLVPNDRKAQLIRSQDLSPKYYDAGMFYFCKTASLFEYKTLVPPQTAAYIIDERECQDIDTVDDWKSAELKYKILRGV